MGGILDEIEKSGGNPYLATANIAAKAIGGIFSAREKRKEAARQRAFEAEEAAKQRTFLSEQQARELADRAAAREVEKEIEARRLAGQKELTLLEIQARQNELSQKIQAEWRIAQSQGERQERMFAQELEQRAGIAAEERLLAREQAVMGLAERQAERAYQREAGMAARQRRTTAFTGGILAGALANTIVRAGPATSWGMPRVPSIRSAESIYQEARNLVTVPK